MTSSPRAAAIGAALVLVLVLVLSTAARTQERIEVFTTVATVGRILEVDATVSGFGRVRSSVPAPDIGFASPVVLSGGRFVVWPAAGGVAIFDRRARTLGVVVLPDAVGVPLALVADRRQPRVFALTVRPGLIRQVWVVDARTAGWRLLLSTSDPLHSFAHAADTDQLFINSNLGGVVPPKHTTDVIDVVTGRLERRLVRTDGLYDLQVSDDGRFLFGLNSPFRIGYLDVVDGQSGATVARGPIVRTPFVLDVQRALVMALEANDEFLLALDPLTLAERWRHRIDLPWSLRGHIATNQVLPGRWMTGAYVMHVETHNDSVCQGIDLLAIDPDGTRRSAVGLLPLPGASGRFCSAVALLVRSPFAPTASAAVSGNTVSLTWSDPGDTADFELEYGFAPGQRAGTLRVGQTTSLTLPGVPAGTYYVRMKAVNEVGASPASNEIRVVVP